MPDNFSTVLHLLVCSLTVAFFPSGLKLWLNLLVRGIKIVTVYRRSIFQVEWLIATLITTVSQSLVSFLS